MTRTAETFQQHLDKRVAACSRSWIILRATDLFGTQYRIVPKACSSAYCPRCRINQLLRIRRALVRQMAHRRWRLVTLTFAQREVTRTQLLRSLARTFDRFIKRIKRRYPDLTYVRTVEIHESGYPHLHLVIDRFVPVALLQIAWKEVGGGCVDIRATRKVAGKSKPLLPNEAARYLTEEIEKAVQDPHQLGLEFWLARIRSIATSRNISLKNDDSPWTFYALANSIDDLDAYWGMVTREAQMNDQPEPNMIFTSSSITMGSYLSSR